MTCTTRGNGCVLLLRGRLAAVAWGPAESCTGPPLSRGGTPSEPVLIDARAVHLASLPAKKAELFDLLLRRFPDDVGSLADLDHSHMHLLHAL